MKSSPREAALRKAGRPLRIEVLEPRAMLHSGPVIWAGGGDLTLSFAPDGTSIAGGESALFATLNELAPAVVWKDAILKGFQTWISHTGASIGVVTDGGDAFGSAGPSRGGSRFGDIRVGAIPLDDGVLAIAVPATDVLSGTWIGDVIINSNAAFASLEEVFAVALHEAGHVFGLEHSDDPLSPMYVHGATPATALTPADVVGVQTILGSPQPDLNERSTTNNAPTNATQLRLNAAASGVPGSAPSLVYGAVSTAADVDYYRLATPPNYDGPITITVRSAGISLLAPTLALLDSSGALIDAASSASGQGDALSLTLNQAPADGLIVIRVAGGRSDVFGVGDYSLTAMFDAINQITPDAIAAAADGSLRHLSQQELAKAFREQLPNFNEIPGDDALSTSVTLSPSGGFLPNSRYETIGSIAGPNDVDFVRVTPPVSGGRTMTVSVRALDPHGLLPTIAVFGHNGQPRPATILVNGNGEYVVQVAGDGSTETVSFAISAADPFGPRGAGSYHLVVDFSSDPIELDMAAAGILTTSAPLQAAPLHVALPQLFHFALAVPSAPLTAHAVVMVTIRDADENIVFRLAARPGETRTAGAVLLAPGTYRVQAVALTGEPLAGDLGFSLYGNASSGPFAANPDDPTYQPEFQCDEPGHEGFYCYPGHFVSPDPYLWQDFTGELTDLPEGLAFQELVETLLAEWWTWVWDQMGVNGPPLARSDTVEFSQQGASNGPQSLTIPHNVLANDIEPEQEPLIAILRSGPSHGQLTLNPDGTFEYTPDLGFLGVDTFRYIAFDSTNESSEATVRIYVGFRGDYDSNGAVDGGDFLAWQRSLGQTAATAGSGADGDGDGVVTVADGWVWADRFGQMLPQPVMEHDDGGDGELLLVDLAELDVSELEPSALEVSSHELLAAPAPLLEEVRYAAASSGSVETVDLRAQSQFAAEPLLRRDSSDVIRRIAFTGATRSDVSATIEMKIGRRVSPSPPSDIWERSIDRALSELFDRGSMKLEHAFDSL